MYKSFLFSIVLLSICAIGSFFITIHLKLVILTLLYFNTLAALGFFMLQQKATNPKLYINTFLLLTAIKMFMSLIAVAIIIFINKETALVNSIYFMVGYFLFLFFETYQHLKNNPNFTNTNATNTL